MRIALGLGLDNRTKAFEVLQTSQKPSALDMGMAPGGFSATILQKYPNASIRAISLPDIDGGHTVQLSHENLKFEPRDINTLARDLGLNSIPETHPEAKTLTIEKLLGEEAEQWRECREARRLQLAHLVIAIEHLKDNGTLIAVLHKPESFNTAEMLRVISGFFDITLFEPGKAHAKRSSFYVVAKNVKPRSFTAVEAVEAWREEWRIATLGSEEEYAILTHKSIEDTQRMLEQYSEKLVALGGPIWATQAKALKKAPYRNLYSIDRYTTDATNANPAYMYYTTENSIQAYTRSISQQLDNFSVTFKHE